MGAYTIRALPPPSPPRRYVWYRVLLAAPTLRTAAHQIHSHLIACYASCRLMFSGEGRSGLQRFVETWTYRRSSVDDYCYVCILTIPVVVETFNVPLTSFLEKKTDCSTNPAVRIPVTPIVGLSCSVVVLSRLGDGRGYS
ncbi:hypothetical protein LshimejAT787_2600080 [Lyophyllum shimeji]|uniref:Uncharacterized protein n=1 Tax=Lyophyllum shimeji TaxID=47721 RepID=A0A9P3PZ28_LYOSH|nr:hypothetical protein LshimejAT787_2600080 [Lyophyllum shimeji]